HRCHSAGDQGCGHATGDPQPLLSLTADAVQPAWVAGNYIAEEILGDRWDEESHKQVYKVRWQDGNTTWEKKANVKDCRAFQEYMARKSKARAAKSATRGDQDAGR